MIAKLLVVSAVWLVISVLLGGVGALARRAFRSRVAGESDVFFDWWVGWALTVVFLLAWHLALAITPWAWVPLAIAGVAGAWMARKDWRRVLQPVLTERGWLVALVLLAWVSVAALALGPDRQYDTALYHLQTVRWSQSYAVVPGVANIHSRFGTNSSFHLFAALVETLRVGGTNLRLAAGILFLPLIVQGISSLHAAVIGQRKMDVLWWFQVLMIPVALWQARQYASALSPDGVVFVLTVVLSAELLRILCRREEAPEGNESGIDWDYRIFGMVLLAGIAITVKLNFAIFGGLVAAIALWKSPSEGTSRRPLLTRIIVSALIVGALYVAHGVILSGYIAYPSPIGSLPVDWRLPRWRVQLDAEWIVSWARSPGMNRREVMTNHDWLARWVAKTARDRDVIAAAISLSLAGVLSVAGRRQRRQLSAPDRTTAFMFLLPALLSLGIWFVTAPAIRFALGPLWVIAVGTLALSARFGDLSLDERRTRIAMRAALLLVLGTAWAVGLTESGSASSRHPVKQITTLSGLTVYVPVKGDQCGDAPLPCASLPPDQRLELRQPGTLAKGFRVAREVPAQTYLRVNTPTGSVKDSRK